MFCTNNCLDFPSFTPPFFLPFLLLIIYFLWLIVYVWFCLSIWMDAFMVTRYLFGLLISLISWKYLVELSREENGFPAGMVRRHQHRNWLEDLFTMSCLGVTAHILRDVPIFLFTYFNISRQEYCCRLSISRIEDPRDCFFLYFWMSIMYICSNMLNNEGTDFVGRFMSIVISELL